jgi:hypothetical protein
MSNTEDEPRLPDGRPVWSATPEEIEARKRELWRLAATAAAAESEHTRQRDAVVAAATRERLSAMPTAAQLGVDVSGLGTARARLIIGRAWIEAEQAKIPALEQRRDAFMRALAMPEATRAELAAVESQATGALREFYDAGSAGELPDLHRAEREVLIERLALEDALAAECSAGLLDEAEIAIATQHRLLAELEGRVEGWISALLVETAAAIAPKVERLVDELRSELAVVVALGQVVEGRSDLRHVAGGTTLALGVPLWGDIDLEVPGGEKVWRHAEAWRAVRDALAADARAVVNAPVATRETLKAMIAPVVAPVSAVRRLLGRGKVEPKPVPEPVAVQQPLGYEFASYTDVVH